MCGPLIQDLAVAAAYHSAGVGHPLADIADVVVGYNAVLPLCEDEVDLLPDLIRTRLATTLVIGQWRAARARASTAYILRNVPAAVQGLRSLAQVSAEEGSAFLRDAVRARAPKGV